MNVFIAYQSKYGNGKKCVEYLKTVINKKGHDVEAASIMDIEPTSLPKANFYVFSSPTHVGGPPRKMKKFLKKISIGQDSKYALMTTCLDTKTRTLEIMDEILRNKNVSKVSEGVKIKVKGMKGPLENDYKDKIDSFVKENFS